MMVDKQLILSVVRDKAHLKRLLERSNGVLHLSIVLKGGLNSSKEVQAVPGGISVWHGISDTYENVSWKEFDKTNMGEALRKGSLGYYRLGYPQEYVSKTRRDGVKQRYRVNRK